MEQALEALELAVRDHDWHRVRLAVQGLRLANRANRSFGGQAQMTLPAQDYANASQRQSKNAALEGDEA